MQARRCSCPPPLARRRCTVLARRFATALGWRKRIVEDSLDGPWDSPRHATAPAPRVPHAVRGGAAPNVLARWSDLRRAEYVQIGQSPAVTDAEMSFRRNLNRWWVVGCIALFFVIGLAGIPESSHDGGYYSTDSGFVIGSRVFYALMAVVSLFLMVKVARMGIFADHRGLTIRNVLRTHRIAWREIASFQRPTGYGAFRRTGLKVVLRNRPPVFASLYSAGPFNKPGFADETLVRLESLRRKHAVE